MISEDWYRFLELLHPPALLLPLILSEYMRLAIDCLSLVLAEKRETAARNLANIED